MKIKRNYNNISQAEERVKNSSPNLPTRPTCATSGGCGGFAPDNWGRVGRVQGTPAQTQTSCGSGGRAERSEVSRGVGGCASVVACGPISRVGRIRDVRAVARVGAKVRRVGAGIWGFGTIVGIVPAGVNPRWYCRRHNLPVLFGVRSESANYVRYIVECDDGRYHTPNKVEVV